MVTVFPNLHIPALEPAFTLRKFAYTTLNRLRRHIIISLVPSPNALHNIETTKNYQYRRSCPQEMHNVVYVCHHACESVNSALISINVHLSAVIYQNVNVHQDLVLPQESSLETVVLR